MKNEIAIGQTQELQIKKAKNQLSTVFSLIQSDEAIRLVNILKRIETDKGIEFLCSFENINWSVELIEKYKDQWVSPSFLYFWQLPIGRLPLGLLSIMGE